MGQYFDEAVNGNWMECRMRFMQILGDEAALEEIVQLVGMDALSAPDRLKMEIARSIREDFLHQDSFHEIDTYTQLEKQYRMMQLILAFYDEALAALNEGVSVEKLVAMSVREKIGRFKYTTIDEVEDAFMNVVADIKDEIKSLKDKED
ncbi:MAG: V-type ATP synthase subunit A, partial [Lachnospiraceae bacterium]|nr:V-type ATP synthase subunit A [Lachnospiraceae bacterium]